MILMNQNCDMIDSRDKILERGHEKYTMIRLLYYWGIMSVELEFLKGKLGQDSFHYGL